MKASTTRWSRLLSVLLAIALLAAACGGSDDDSTSGVATSDDTEAADTTEEAEPEPTEAQITIGGDESEPEDEPVEDEPAEADDDQAEAEAEPEPEPTEEPVAEEVAAPEGTLRFVEFSAVTSFNPAASQTAQSAYLYPVYDTLLRQNADFTLAPSLATAWTQISPNVWQFEVRDDVVFHDGAAFNAQVAVDNINYHAAFEGNPNAATWAAFSEARVIDDVTFEVEFVNPAPQFPLEMSMVMGMMISPNALDGADLTRDPQGSGPWIWSADDSQAGVTEVFNLNPDYWNPADQGVETVSVTAVPDNNARMNALLTGEADIMATTRDAQIDTGLDAGNVLMSVPNYFPYIIITGRDGAIDEPLANPDVRRAILLSVDRDAYNDAIHASKGDSLGGIYPPAFGQFHVPEIDDKYSYDPEEARRLLTEAGYPDGIEIQMPIMPAINPHVELLVQMLGSSGINVDLIQINNGELGPGTAAGEWGIAWFRDLLVHPARDLGKFTAIDGRFNVFGLDDTAELDALLVQALESADPDEARELYGQVMEGLIDLGVVIPLAHGGQNGMHTPETVGAVLGLNMQAPMPYGVTVAG